MTLIFLNQNFSYINWNGIPLTGVGLVMVFTDLGTCTGNPTRLHQNGNHGFSLYHRPDNRRLPRTIKIFHQEMQFMRLLLIFCTLILSACTTTSVAVGTSNSSTLESKEQVTDTSKPRKICKREKPTGSHRTIVTCRTVEQIENEKESARALMNRSGSMAPPTGGRQ